MPLPVLTVAQMRDWEKETWAAGHTEAEVIRRVGMCVGSTALQLTHPHDRILLLAGRGNNGADALAARDHLLERRVDVLPVSDPAEDLPKLDALLSLQPALVVDALFGIGLNRSLSDAWVQFINHLNASKLPVLAVDVPSGLDADSGQPQPVAVHATVTLTVGAPKAGLLQQPAWPYVGRLEVAHEVGLIGPRATTDVNWVLPEDFAGFPPPRMVEGHKGTYGHLAILAGSLGYHGAAVLAARAAQRAQPGLITLHTLDDVYLPIAAQLQAVMVHPWNPETLRNGPWSAIVIGPGLAAANVPETLKDQVRQLWLRATVPVAVDASALGWLPTGRIWSTSARVITPHPGEAARLLDTTADKIQSARAAAVRKLSMRFGDCHVVLKGHQTLTGHNSGTIRVNSSGNPHLAQGGSGDVLSGYLGGLLAQPGLAPDVAVRFAVWQHGAAADQLQRQQRNWVVEDLLEKIGDVAG